MIQEFRGKYRYLSNFAYCEILLDGIKYPTIENAYQATKTIISNDREPFEIITASQSKSRGRMISIRHDWEEKRIPIMSNLIRQKYWKEPFKSALLTTGDNEIQEGNYWGDTFWGVCRGIGCNNLGKIIMLVRTEIRLNIQPSEGILNYLYSFKTL